ncbi:MAG: RNA polymerase sporulation sigma factor SigK [bacterium]|nr:RNA polymerase sporulation sigma factor SigK [bacterium]
MFLSMLSALLSQAWVFLSHMAGKSSFPKALTEKEEKALIARLQAGDDSARRELVEHNLRLVAHIAKKYLHSDMDQDDLVSIGSIGLIKAVASYRPESGRLAAYASRCIENEMLMALRSSKKYRANVSLNQPIGSDSEGNEIQIMDILGTDEDAVMDSVALRIESGRVVQLMEQVLDQREQAVIRLRYGILDGECRPQHEVARQLGISRSYVSRIEKHALEMLRAGLTGGNVGEAVGETAFLRKASPQTPHEKHIDPHKEEVGGV